MVTFLRSQGIHCFIYSHHLLPLNKNPTTLKEHTLLALDLLEALDYLVNYPKSHLPPSQPLQYPGFLIDSLQRELHLPKTKLNIKSEAAQILTSDRALARRLAQLIGKMSVAIFAVYPARLHYRGLQSLKHKALANSGYYGQAVLSVLSKKDPRWWVHW